MCLQRSKAGCPSQKTANNSLYSLKKSALCESHSAKSNPQQHVNIYLRFTHSPTRPLWNWQHSGCTKGEPQNTEPLVNDRIATLHTVSFGVLACTVGSQIILHKAGRYEENLISWFLEGYITTHDIYHTIFKQPPKTNVIFFLIMLNISLVYSIKSTIPCLVFSTLNTKIFWIN